MSWLKLLRYLKRGIPSFGANQYHITNANTILLDKTIAASRAPPLEGRRPSENLTPTWMNASDPNIPNTMEHTSPHPNTEHHISLIDLPSQACLRDGHTSGLIQTSPIMAFMSPSLPAPCLNPPATPHWDDGEQPHNASPISHPESGVYSEATVAARSNEEQNSGYLAPDGRITAAFSDPSSALPAQDAAMRIHGQATPTGHVSLNSRVDRLRNVGIRPIDTFYIERYARGLKVDPTPGIPVIKPLTIRRDYAKLPGTWKSCVHPEGILYYHDTVRKVSTDANIRDSQILNKIETTIEHLNRERLILNEECSDMTEEQRQLTDKFPSDSELVLELPTKEHLEALPHLLCYYYYVSHETRTLFWLNEMYTEHTLLRDVEGVTEEAHLKYLMEAEYWKHWEFFPLCRTVSEGSLREVIGIMMAGAVDQSLSRTSTFPHRFEDCKELIELVKNTNYVKEIDGYSAWVIGRLMNTFCYNRFLHFHGQPVARMNRTQAIYNNFSKPKTLLITLLGPFFFFAPAVHLCQLESVWTDRIVNDIHWKRFIDRLQEEWERFLLPATVLLGANFAFLAIPGVDPSGQSPVINNFGNSSIVDSLQALNSSVGSSDRSFGQICSYISVVASTATIILSLVLDRRHRSDAFMTSSEAAGLLIQRLHPVFGMELIAIIYSLPYVSLMWGMITFVVAVCAITRVIHAVTGLALRVFGSVPA